jgi:methanol--5-hydroxybenzimidazolylcobamide Co-methyltransferase
MPLQPFIVNEKDLLFGKAPRPVTCGKGLVIGGGTVYPEINFTLPKMNLGAAERREARRQYEEMISDVCQRAVELKAPGVVVEIELLPPMTLEPEWGAEITAVVRECLDRFHDKHGLKSAFRLTPVDVRDNERPPRMRTGDMIDRTLKSFELCAKAGADLLSIESTGGKELHDEALLQGDLQGVVFALGVLACRDMNHLWERIVGIAKSTNTIAAGDTACGFANTAMILADKGMIPRVFAAVVRVASVVRSLQAFAYEGPFIKALTGAPISMEGKSSACAHLSHLGNIAGAACDLWSNESVQNVRLLSASAPIVSMEQLIYDCRLMNQALAEGNEEALRLRRWMVESDAPLDPQAWVLRPDVVVRVTNVMAKADNPLAMTIAGVNETLALLREAHQKKEFSLSATEERWLDLLSFQAEAIPEEEEMLAMAVLASQPEPKYLPEEYGLTAV